MYGLHTLPDSIRNWILDSPRLPKLADGSYPYKYSDFSFYFLQQVAEQIIKEPIDKFVKRQFFDSLGAYSLRYNPLLSIPDSNIAPTEKDTVFRHILLRGTVHDQLAALQGGIGGHAGLFGTANDVAKVMQLQLNGGDYGGTMFLPMDIAESYQRVSSTGSYRGLGWDKPQLNNANNPTSVYASPETFGHSGFTGTCAWADPKYKIVFVFLSNRICPDANNKKISEQRVRPRIMDVIYRSMMDSFPLVTPLATGVKKDSTSRP
jgi:CubicO group peptidase (beta-lactamase class C family)